MTNIEQLLEKQTDLVKLLPQVNIFKIDQSFSYELPMFLQTEQENIAEDFALPIPIIFVDVPKSFAYQDIDTSVSVLGCFSLNEILR